MRIRNTSGGDGGLCKSGQGWSAFWVFKVSITVFNLVYNFRSFAISTPIYSFFSPSAAQLRFLRDILRLLHHVKLDASIYVCVFSLSQLRRAQSPCSDKLLTHWLKLIALLSHQFKRSPYSTHSGFLSSPYSNF